MQLAKAVEQRKEYLINQLSFYGHDVVEVEKLTLSELEALHIKVKCQIGHELSKIDAEG